MHLFLQDFRFALRSLVKTKTFSAVVLLTLALCIGANTAIFSLLHAVLLRPLPYPDPDRLVVVYNSYVGADIPKASASAPNYNDRREATDVFEELALFVDVSHNVGDEGSPERVKGLTVTPSLFRALKSQPYIGRIFTEEEGERGNHRVVILGYGIWQRQFASGTNVLGKQLRLNGTLHEVVGVMPASFKFVTSNAEYSRNIQLWTPLSFTAKDFSDNNLHSNGYGMIGRLRPDVTIAQAETRIEALNQAADERAPQFRALLKDAGFATTVQPWSDEVVEEIRSTLLFLQGGVLFVLIIGCVNVANLLLVRSNARLKELAVRFALGASRVRLTRLLLIESVLLGVAGGVLGVGLAYGGVSMIRTLGVEQIPRGAEIGIDPAVLAFTFAVAVIAGIFFGMVPLVHVFRHNLNDVFRQVGRTGTAERKALATRGALVVAQVSLAFVLLMGSGLLISSFRLVLEQDPGFRPERVLTAQLTLPQTRYKEPQQVHEFVRRALDSVRAIPGVSDAAINNNHPFTGDGNSSVTQIVGYTLAPGEVPPIPEVSWVNGSYFQVMGIPLLDGRTLDLSDGPDSTKVVIVDEYLAAKYWPGRSAIGGQINMSLGVNDVENIYTVVGVAGNARKQDLGGEELPGALYFGYQQSSRRGLTVAVKTELEEVAIVGALNAVVLQIDPELPLFDIKTMEARLDDSLVARRATLMLSGVFAFLALLLSGVGIFGVLSYAVSQRTREIGIRSALGARPADVIKMVSSYGLRLAAIGLAIGAVGAYALAGSMSALLYGVEPTDPAIIASVAAVLGAVALLAAVIPAIRAMRIQPMAALRHE